MTAPSHHDRIEIWRYAYARSSLVDAKEAAKLLIAHPEFPDEKKDNRLSDCDHLRATVHKVPGYTFQAHNTAWDRRGSCRIPAVAR
jgi:hypothetical protein